MAVPYPYSEVGHYEEQYGLKENHDALLEILVAFDKFCSENGISYSLGDGTLLGVLRHGDFIPWDDDADVMVTREEYDKIRACIGSATGIKMFKLSFLDRVTIPKYAGTDKFIDLFINDEMPKSKFLFKHKKNMTYMLRCHFANQGTKNHRRTEYSGAKRTLRYVLGGIGKFIANIYIGKRDVWELNDSIVRLGNAKGSGIYTRFTSRMYETKRRFNKAKYDEGYTYADFRGARLMVLKNADVFLNEMYGDFSNLPPEEKRIPEHSVEFEVKIPDSYFKYFN